MKAKIIIGLIIIGVIANIFDNEESSAEIKDSFVPGGHTFTLTVPETVSGRYVKYALTPVSQFIFLSEITAEVHYK